MGQLTILFVDQVGSTRQLAEIGDRAVVKVRRRLKEIIESCTTDNHGRVFSDIGDGMAAVFEEPRDAVFAALAMLASAEQSRVDSLKSHAIHLRIGLHSGEPIPHGDGFVGLDVHICARMCDAAPDNHVVATERTTALLESPASFRVSDFGTRAMKGLAEPLQINLITSSDGPGPQDVLFAYSDAGSAPMRSSPWLDERALARTFVGRETEELRLAESAMAVAGGASRLVLVSGAAGLGKTTLVHRTCRNLVADANALCLVGRCDETVEPYRAIVEALRHLVEVAPQPLLKEHVRRHGNLLTRLVPALGQRVPGLVAGSDGQPGERYQLFEAVADLLRSVAQSQPVVLVVEDLHWASEQTLDLLGHISRASGIGPLLVVGTYRPAEVDASHSLRAFIGRVQADVGTQRVRLSPLNLDNVCDLIRDAAIGIAEFPNEPTHDRRVEELGEHLYRQTAGSPLFLREMLRSLEESGDLGRILRSEAPVAIGRVPETVQELAAARVDRLGPTGADVLGDAAILGSSFRISVLEEMVGDDSEIVLATLEQAERAGIVREETMSADGAFSFTHGLLQDALYARVGSVRRRRRHRAAADATTHTAGANVREVATDVLHHLLEAGQLADPEEIVSAAGFAADDAAEKIALEKAVDYRQIAVDAARQIPDLPAADMAEVLLGLAVAQTAGGLAVGRKTTIEAAAYASEAERWDILARAAICYGGEYKENQAIFDITEQVDLCKTALAHFPERTVTRARLLTALAVWQRQHVPFDDRFVLVSEALDIAREVGDARALADVIHEWYRALHGPNVAEEAAAMSLELEALGAELSDDAVVLEALNLRLLSDAALGNWTNIQRTAQQFESVGDRVRNIEGRRLGLCWNLNRAAVRGDFDESASYVREQRSFLSHYRSDEKARYLSAMSFLQPHFAGHNELLYSMLNEMHLGSYKAWFAGDAGLLDEAVEAIDGYGPLRQLAVDANYLFWSDAVGLTRGIRAVGDRARALELYEILLPYASHNAVMGAIAFLGAANHHLGGLAAVLGRFDDAVAHYEQALARHREMGARPYLALTLTELAALLDERGEDDDERVASLRSEAGEIAAALNLGFITAQLPTN